MKTKKSQIISYKVEYFFLCFLLTFIMLCGVEAFSQSVGIGANAFTPDASAILEVNSTTQGMLMPRMTTSQRTAITSPAEGLQIFNTTTKCFEAYVNGAWNTVSCPATCIPPAAPVTGTHTPTQTQIVWNWNTVSGATGYKWGTTDVYSAATDNGASTSKTQTGLTCNTNYTLYVWAYNACGNSTSTTLTQTTSSCCTSGSIADGTLIKTTTCGTYTVISWTYSSSPGSTTWTVPSGVTSVEYLVVAGGGGSGSTSALGWEGGAGGAGGYRTNVGGTLLSVSGTQNVVVGAGGIAAASGNNNGGKGGNSAFGSISATGGGYGGYGDQSTGQSGGNGGSGGAAGQKTSGLSGGIGNEGGYSPVEGYNGSVVNGNVAAGGGAGGAASGNTPGVGLTNNITGSSVTYATGGKSSYDNDVSGLNTGDGANQHYTAAPNGGHAGAKGVVIIRYYTP